MNYVFLIIMIKTILKKKPKNVGYETELKTTKGINWKFFDNRVKALLEEYQKEKQRKAKFQQNKAKIIVQGIICSIIKKRIIYI